MLASQSPRRLQILRRRGVSVLSHPVQVSEIPDENLNLSAQIEGLARLKLETCLKMRTPPETLGNLVLAADTVVILDGQILGKPVDRQVARQTLVSLSGRTHEVITGVAVCDLVSGRVMAGSQSTGVRFRVLSETEIEWYLDRGEWTDKAGGYGIQGRAREFVADLMGDFDNVVGLPMRLVDGLCRQLQVALPMANSEMSARVHGLLHEVERLCVEHGRWPWSVGVVGVAKTKPAELVVEAIRSGLDLIGENYVQEALEKQTRVQAIERQIEPDWHFVGSLQSNKAKSVAGRFSLIHSLDRSSLTRELQRRCAERDIVQDVLVELNISREATKGGLLPEQLADFVKEVGSHPNLRLRGLMAMPEIGPSEAASRESFRRVRNAFAEIKAGLSLEKSLDFDTLSTGTTGDFQAAIAEGSNLIRVGTRIFGAREG